MMNKKRVRKLCVLAILFCIFFAISRGVWEVIDPLNERTDSAPLVYILDNQYVLDRREEPMDEDLIGDFIGEVTKKTISTPNQNGESNHLEKGIELFYVKNVDSKIKIAVLYKGKYYTYIDSSWN